MPKFVKASPSCFVILGIAFVATIMYLNKKDNLFFNKKHQDEALSIFKEALVAYLSNKSETQRERDSDTFPDGKLSQASRRKLLASERGFWQGLGAVREHMFDKRLAFALLNFLKAENVKTVLELGAGTGAYASVIKSGDILISCYDGNPETQILSNGQCGVIDLSRPIDLCKHDWTLSLEVGEHIPQQYEEVFIQNLVKGNRYGVILSWAVEGQGGLSHVNTRNNSYIRNKMAAEGYTSDLKAEQLLRTAAFLGWFKNTLMVFRRAL